MCVHVVPRRQCQPLGFKFYAVLSPSKRRICENSRWYTSQLRNAEWANFALLFAFAWKIKRIAFVGDSCEGRGQSTKTEALRNRVCISVVYRKVESIGDIFDRREFRESQTNSKPWDVSKSSRIYWIANNSFRSSGYFSLVSSANTCANLFVIVDENCFAYFFLRFFFFSTLFFYVFFPGNIQTWKYTEIAVGNVFPFPSSVNIFLFRERNFRSRAFRFFVGLVITQKKFAFLLIFLSSSATSLGKENEMIRR